MPTEQIADAQPYAAYDRVTDWFSRTCATAGEAEALAHKHNRALRAQGGFGSAGVVQRDHRAPGRTVDACGGNVWPPHGRSTGTVRWRPASN